MAEVEAVAQGIQLFIGDNSLFLPFAQFPWFDDKSIEQVSNVEELVPDHMYWPDLDVDLSLNSIEHPERFPLIAR